MMWVSLACSKYFLDMLLTLSIYGPVDQKSNQERGPVTARRVKPIAFERGHD